DIAGGDSEGRHAVTAVLAGDGACHGYDARLGGGVVPVLGVFAAEGCAAGEVDDDAAAVLSRECEHGSAAQHRWGEEVDFEGEVPHAGPLLERSVQRGGRVDTSVVNQHVDAPVHGQRLVPQPLRGGRLAEIGGERVRVVTYLLLQGLDGLQGDIVQQDGGA